MLLPKTTRGGEARVRNLRQRTRLIDTGTWGQLLSLSGAISQNSTSTPAVTDVMSKLKWAAQLAKLGGLSHTARKLQSVGLAPGNLETLAELCGPRL